MAGGEWDGLDAVSAEYDQLWVARLPVHDEQVEDWHRRTEDLQLLLQVGARQVGVGRVHQDLHHLAPVGADEEDVEADTGEVLGTLVQGDLGEELTGARLDEDGNGGPALDGGVHQAVVLDEVQARLREARALVVATAWARLWHLEERNDLTF